eukprot:TRINITY_DN5525_c0_g1_i1.p1 TRINITY_DN5525_c0_g1~~TRINITY_DN5525_c0_g1_i1.p1  ORF type:complete len:242 (+),score=53.21 TRINITY_DN5525_c0_g1_i1:51-728(+)
MGLLPTACSTTEQLFTSACATLLISKALSMGILVGALLLKVPQIIALYNSGSGEGVSLPMYQLELLGYVIYSLYGFVSGLPFTTYGEVFFITIQDIIIVLMLARYTKRSILETLGYFSLLGGLGFAMGGGFLSNDSIQLLQGATIPIFATSRLFQIVALFKEKNSGQLSFASTFLSWAGTAARVFTTLSEVSDNLVLAGVLQGFILNGIIIVQMLYYGNSKKKTE